MFLSSRLALFTFFLSYRYDWACSLDVQCQYSNAARDQGLLPKRATRSKRFVLFPEFQLWKDDWRYLHHPTEFSYWISNYYPQQVNSLHVRTYLQHIIASINEVIDGKIVSVTEASSIERANFHYRFFNYQICPTNDPSASTADVQSSQPLLIYPENIVRENHYRAHGGIALNHHDNTTTSHVKLNTHHTFLSYDDFQYDPVRYTCNAQRSHCAIDLYGVLLHETLHGFGIEHTEPNPPNPQIRAVMHLYASRIMCHDDIRAIRKVYGQAVRRQNSEYDDTCRRDFPLDGLQKLMRKLHRWIVFHVLQLGSSISGATFVLTMVYLALRKRNHCAPSAPKQHKKAINAYLWHDEFLNNSWFSS